MSEHDSFASADELVIGGPGAPRPHSRRRWWIGGLALCVAGAGAGAAAWAAVSFFGTGDQPAEALPDSTIGYLGIDLDPSGGQKLAALQVARKFPALKDQVGLGTGDDLRKWLFDGLSDGSDCAIDYARDIEPWLGSRAAFAAVGADKPFPVLVVQTTDADKAQAGLRKLAACDEPEDTAWRTVGDWTVVAETQAQVDRVVADTKKGSLADDAHFQEWTGKAGDSGILTAYAAPAAGGYLAEQMARSGGTAGGGVASEACPGAGGSGPSVKDLQARLADFTGAAATLRLRSDGLELGMVGDAKALQGAGGAIGKPARTGVVTSLPADTAAALGFSLPKGWTEGISTSLSKVCGGAVDLDDLLAPLTAMTGLSLPGDLEKLVGDSFALALGPDIDVEALVNSGDPSSLPLAVKTRGDKATVDKLVAALRRQLGPAVDSFQPVAGDGSVALAADRSYAATVAGDGGLGASKTFRAVVPHADEANAVLFVDVDRLDATIASLAGDDPDVVGNTKPLQAIGLSSWVDGADAHSVLEISLD
jgi:hypothetical protein